MNQLCVRSVILSMVKLILRVLAMLGLASFPTAAFLAPQTAGAEAVPKGGVIDVTGFRTLTLDGSRGPVTVTVKGRNAATLRVALSSLAPKPSGDLCQESIVPFTVSFFPHGGAHPTLVASAFVCDGPGISVTVGRSMTQLKDDCALQIAVINALPHGHAEGTRQAVGHAMASECPTRGSH
jgi:hypothetical protein